MRFDGNVYASDTLDLNNTVKVISQETMAIIKYGETFFNCHKSTEEEHKLNTRPVLFPD